MMFVQLSCSDDLKQKQTNKNSESLFRHALIIEKYALKDNILKVC